MPFNGVNFYYLGQGIGILAFLIGLTVFIQRDDKKLKIRLAIYTAFMGLHFFARGDACRNKCFIKLSSNAGFYLF